MSKYLALSLVGLLFPVAAQAQDEIIKDFGAAQVEKFIKEVMKSEPLKDNQTPGITFYSTPDGQYDVYLRTAPKALFFKYSHQTLQKTKEQMQAWNSGKHLTHAFMENGKVVLQASLNLETGLSMRQFTDYYAQIQKERLDFEK